MRKELDIAARCWFLRRRLRCQLFALGVLGAVVGGARGAEIDGIQVPETVQADGKVLHLNGVGLRTYSILRLHVYVAALYLEHPSTDPGAVLSSPETKLLTVRFLRDVSADTARKSWQTGFANNCLPPACSLDPAEVTDFLDHVPAMRAGDRFSLLFDEHGAAVDMDGHPLGVVPQPKFAEAMLATFLGPRPGSNRLKRELLAGRAVQANQ